MEYLLIINKSMIVVREGKHCATLRLVLDFVDPGYLISAYACPFGAALEQIDRFGSHDIHQYTSKP